jgi:hypothetical protein
MAKYTQGPWFYDPCVTIHGEDHLPCVVDEFKLVVAQTLDDGHTEDECEANARLIAAAPGLLELVIRYRNETPLGHQPHMIAHLADAAIAKATGQ